MPWIQDPILKTTFAIYIQIYTKEPIYFHMIGKNARHNQVLISKNDHLQISPRKPGWDHNDPGHGLDGVLEITMNLGHYGPTQVFWD